MLCLAIVLAALLPSVNAGCDNRCSGHGTCGVDGVCQCYDNWGLGLSHDSGDCSDRICPFEFAWVDTPDKKGLFHKYAECAGKGICGRDTGECTCFPGYEGKACQRTTCPNDCSGHGRCEYIQNLPFAATPFDYKFGDFYPQYPFDKFSYYGWDKQKIRGCVCDPEYGDVDCSKRMCQYGTDVMDHRNDLTRATRYQVQKLSFVANQANLLNLNPELVNGGVVRDKTFALTFKSKLNETFTTTPIVFDGNPAGLRDFLSDIEHALESLPNQVIDDVVVAGDFGIAGTFGVSGTGANDVFVNITFVGNNVQGPQHLITVKAYECGDGCTPKITGLELRPGFQNVTEVTLSDYNSFECGRRGKCDYTTGTCACFEGYTGLSCNVITSLV